MIWGIFSLTSKWLSVGWWGQLFHLASSASLSSKLEYFSCWSQLSAQLTSLARLVSKVFQKKGWIFCCPWKFKVNLPSFKSICSKWNELELRKLSDSFHGTHLGSKLLWQLFENIHVQHFIIATGPESRPNFPVPSLLYHASNWPYCIKDYTCCFGENSFEIIVTVSFKFQNQNNWWKNCLQPKSLLL